VSLIPYGFPQEEKDMKNYEKIKRHLVHSVIMGTARDTVGGVVNGGWEKIE
jgi:hypothetical protein